MIITCENCHASYRLDDSLLDPAGSRVRCTNCGHVFVARPPSEVSAPEDDGPVPAPAEDAFGGIDEMSPRQRRGFESAVASEGKAPVSTGGEEAAFETDLDLDDGDQGGDAGQPEGLALDLDLDLDDDVKEFAANTEELEELDLDLDLEPMTTQLPEKAETGAPSEEEPDLEEIQKMLSIDDEALETLTDEDRLPPEGDSEALAGLELDLEKPETPPGTGRSDKLDLELNLDLDIDAEETQVPGADSSNLDLDLDLEDTEGLPGSDGVSGTEELDLSLEPLDSGPTAAKTEVFEEDELDLGDIDTMLQTDEETTALAVEADREESGTETSPDATELETAEIAAGLLRSEEPEAEMDLYGEETGAPRDPESDEKIAALGQAYTLRTVTGADGQTSLTAEPEPIGAAETEAGGGRRRPAWPLVALLLLGLIVGGLYWAGQQGGDLAFLSQFLGQETADEAGNLKISTLSIDSRFVENATSGRLFVVSGKARNDYDRPRSQIQIKGSLLAKGKRLVGSETVFCGNVLTDLDLNRLEIAEIKRRLGQKTGANNSNVDVPPGRVVPFMVVFDNLPPDLEEFTIEVLSSK